DGGVEVRGAAEARFSVEVGRLKDLVRLVVAVAGIDRADEGEAVEHGSMFRQMLTEADSRQPGSDGAEGAAVHRGTVRLGVPGVDVAGSARHPQEDEALVTFRLADRASLEESGEGEAGDTGEASLEEVTPGGDGQSLA